jgi:hypothetical protein
MFSKYLKAFILEILLKFVIKLFKCKFSLIIRKPFFLNPSYTLAITMLKVSTSGKGSDPAKIATLIHVGTFQLKWQIKSLTI